ncbi:catalase [Microcoleus sp. Pol12B5]|uniref:catalase n=1 Tax=Microcoleus sp. Pol12B5 TaxID=3055396 RepID=UPI00403F221F
MGINNSLHLARSKIISEELFPVAAIGKMVSNRNPDNCFAEAQERATLTPTMVLSLKNLPTADAFDRFASRITYAAVLIF